MDKSRIPPIGSAPSAKCLIEQPSPLVADYAAGPASYCKARLGGCTYPSCTCGVVARQLERPAGGTAPAPQGGDPRGAARALSMGDPFLSDGSFSQKRGPENMGPNEMGPSGEWS